jgi:hypothetical protein
MSDLRELGIEVTESDDGVRYHFPLRPLGPYRPFGLILIIFGIAFAAFPTWGISSMARGMAGNQGNPAILFTLLAVLFDIPFLLAGFALIGFGLVLMAGRSVIELTATHLISFEGIGSLGLRRRRAVAGLRRLKVEPMSVKKNDKPITEGPLADLAGLRAEFKDAKSLLMAPGYPQSWLRLVAEDIARRRPETGDVSDPEAESTKVQVIDVVRADPNLADIPDQPAGSKVLVEQQPQSIVLTVPPAGLWRGSKGLFAFALFWLGFMVVFTTMVLFIRPGDGLLIFIAFITLFWGVGIALLLAAINMGRRKAVLAVVDGTLMIYQTGLFRAKRHEWPKDKVEAIRTGPSGMEVNEAPVLELQVISTKGTKVGLLAGRDLDELRWLATVLRRNLNPKNLPSETKAE